MRNICLISPLHCDPPHRITHPDKLVDLANDFVAGGWSEAHPVLVGYVLNGRVQLLSGTHRHGAAVMAGISVPIWLHSYETVEEAWGDGELWANLMNAPNLNQVPLVIDVAAGNGWVKELKSE